jgi:Recombination endonuclease VII/Arm DNA-binding domain
VKSGKPQLTTGALTEDHQAGDLDAVQDTARASLVLESSSRNRQAREQGSGHFYRRCGCRDENGKQYARSCPKLASDPKHGSWAFYLSAGHNPKTGKRRQYSKTGFPTKQAAQAALVNLRIELSSRTVTNKKYPTLPPRKPGACAICDGPNPAGRKYCPTCTGPQEHHNRLWTYGVSHPEWLTMLAVHNGKCWICRTAEAKVVDHSHRTGTVRGALCHACNHGLSVLEKPYEWLDKARAYLREHSGLPDRWSA